VKLLVLDTETTGLDLADDPVIEVAGALLSTTTKEVLAEFSFLVKTDKLNATFHVNGIPDAALQEIPSSPEWLNVGLCILSYYASQADALVAHNVKFDAPRLQMLGLPIDRPFLCTREDIRITGTKASKLSHIAVDLGLPVLKLHRAAADVRLLIQILCALPNLDSVIQDALQPKKTVKALVSFHQKDFAKAEGFFFDNASKNWLKKLSTDEIKNWQNKHFAIVEA